jgi:hypothetical protein
LSRSNFLFSDFYCPAPKFVPAREGRRLRSGRTEFAGVPNEIFLVANFFWSVYMHVQVLPERKNPELGHVRSGRRVVK